MAFESVPEKFNWILGAGSRLFQSIGIPTAIEDGNEDRGGSVARTFSLKNYPNPFNPSTTLAFTIPSNCFVTLKVFDLLGREVSTVVAEELSAGSYARTWNAADMASGLYLCRLQAGSYHATSKLVLMK